MLVGKRMTHNPITITPDVPISEAMEWMRREKVRRFPVVNKPGKDGKLIGIVTNSDLQHAAPSSVTSLNVWEVTYLLSQVTVKEVMTKEVITICEDCPIEEAARIMADNKISGLPVMRDDRVVGIITESDLFRVFLEVFGAREKGVRMTLLAPNVKGSLAQVSSAITARGGYIVSLIVSLADDPSNWVCTVKVSDITREELIETLKPVITEIVDIREM
jgi:acetoin utilization protein AcuB